MDFKPRGRMWWGLSVERAKWQCQRKGTVKERKVTIDFYIIDCFEMTLKSPDGSLRHIRSDQTFQRKRTSTVTLLLEELLNSTDLENQVADMLLHVDYGFTMLAKRISKFIHKEVRTLGLEYEMVKISVKLGDLTKIEFDKASILAKYATQGLETIEHNNITGVDEEATCPICFEILFMGDSKNDEAIIIIRTPCAHMFHKNCIETWLKRNRTCPTCRFKIKVKFTMQNGKQIWTYETNFHDQLHVTLG